MTIHFIITPISFHHCFRILTYNVLKEGAKLYYLTSINGIRPLVSVCMLWL